MFTTLTSYHLLHAASSCQSTYKDVINIGECKRCGSCCMTVSVERKGVKADRLYMEWAKARGLKIEGDLIIINSPCPHLRVDSKEAGKYLCDIYSRRPYYCRAYRGQTKGYYAPKTCGFKE